VSKGADWEIRGAAVTLWKSWVGLESGVHGFGLPSLRGLTLVSGLAGGRFHY
jgi:hypothetical protein